MSDQVENPLTESQKFVVLKFRTKITKDKPQSLGRSSGRFEDVEQVLEDIFKNKNLRSA